MFNNIKNMENATLFSTTGVTHTWSKPSGFNYFFFIMSGGGGGGGSGALGGDRAAGGGGGGGSGAHVCFLIDAEICPKQLFISLGAGGAGGAAAPGNGNGNAGTTGAASQLALSSSLGTDSIMVCNGGTGGVAGNTTGAAGGGAGGTASLVSATRFFPIIPVAPRTLTVTAINLVGDPGTAGGNATAEAPGTAKDISALAPKFIFGGTGGGSVGRATGDNFLGGAMTNASAGFPWIPTPSVATGIKGQPSKIVLPYGFFVSGGVGGQGGGSAQGGGDALFGAGGGGSGASWTGTTTRAGGRGGDGFVLIKAM